MVMAICGMAYCHGNALVPTRIQIIKCRDFMGGVYTMDYTSHKRYD